MLIIAGFRAAAPRLVLNSIPGVYPFLSGNSLSCDSPVFFVFFSHQALRPANVISGRTSRPSHLSGETPAPNVAAATLARIVVVAERKMTFSKALLPEHHR